MTNSSASAPPDTSRPAASAPGFLARAIALLLAVLFILSLPIALLAFDIWQVVFNPPLVKRVVADEAVNHALIPVGLEWFSDRRARERVEKAEYLSGEDEPDIVLLMSFLGRDDWAAIKNEVLTPEILTDWVSETVDGTYAWIDSDAAVPMIVWTLQAFKNRVKSEHGQRAILIAYDNLPPCTQAEIDDFLRRGEAAAPKEVLYNLCQFPDPWREDQVSDYVNALNDVTDTIPSEFALTRELQASGAGPGGAGAAAIKQQLRLIRLMGQWIWLVPVVLMLLITALAVRSFKSFARWWGISLLAGGLLALLPALICSPLITGFLASGPLSETPDSFKDEASHAVARLASAVFQPMLIQAGVVVAAGIVLVALSRLEAKRAARGSETTQAAQ